MSKLNLFNNGGWLNSVDGAFNQPSTYVGMRYVPRNPDVPDLDGIREFLKENERIRKEHEAYRKAASPDEAKFAELMEKAQGKSLTGQAQQLASEWALARAEFAKKYQGDAVFSEEAKSDLARITSMFSPARLVELSQNQDLFNQQKERVAKEEIQGEIFTDGQYVLAQDAETGEIREVPISMYSGIMADENYRKRFRLLTNQEALDYKDKNWKLGEADRLGVGNMMSMGNINKFVNDMLTGVGHTSSEVSQEQITSLKGMLQNAGVDLSSGTNVFAQLKTKYKDNAAQLAQVTKRIYETLPRSAQAGIMSQMYAMGEDPFAMVEIDTPEGKQKVSNLSLKLQDIVMSSTGSRRVQESGNEVGFKSMESVTGEGNTGEMPTNLLHLAMINPSMLPSSTKTKMPVFDPYLAQEAGIKPGDRVDVVSFEIKDEQSKSQLPGQGQIEVPTTGKVFVFAGKEVRLGQSNSPTDPRHAAILPPTNRIVLRPQIQYDKQTNQPMIGTDGKPIKKMVPMAERIALVPGATVESLNREFDGKAFEEGSLKGFKPIGVAEGQYQDVDPDEILDRYGLTEEQKDQARAAWGWSDNVHALTIYEPISEFELQNNDSNPNRRGIFSGMSNAFINEATSGGRSNTVRTTFDNILTRNLK